MSSNEVKEGGRSGAPAALVAGHDAAVEIDRIPASQRFALDQLLQLYVHDFSDFLRPEQLADVGEDGRFAPFPRVEAYLAAPDRSAWFIRVNGKIAGFALIDAHAHSGQAVDYNVGEFFVLRRYRRGGVGARALAALLAAHRGVWEIAIGARNAPAQSFWPRAVATAGYGEGMQTLAGDGVEWTGPILRFRVA